MTAPRTAALLLAVLLAAPAALADDPRILVYTRNHTPDGKGYVHDNIPKCVESLKEIGAELGRGVDVSDDPAVFSPKNLARYGVVVFANSNNEAFATEDQRRAFQDYMKRGGGMAGIHSASGSERDWPFFWSALGGRFRRHPRFQKFVVRVADAGDPIVAGLPETFEWEDEFYYVDFLNPDVHPLLVVDPTTLDDPKAPKDPGSLLGDAAPVAWRLEAGGGRTFYTSLGHKAESYAHPLMRSLLKGGIQWTMGGEKP